MVSGQLWGEMLQRLFDTESMSEDGTRSGGVGSDGNVFFSDVAVSPFAV